MGYAVNWTDLPKDLVIDVAHRLSYLEEFVQFTAVCKSWKSATEAHKPMWLPTRCPMLLLAEDVAPGAIRFNSEYSDTEEDEDEDEGTDGEEEEEEEEEEDDEDFNSEYSDTEEDEDEDEGTDGEEEEEEEEEEEDDEDFNSEYSDTEEDEDEGTDGEEEEEEEEEEDNEEEGGDDVHAKLSRWRASYDYLKNSIGSSRRLYSLLSMKTYNIELPEAAGRLILGTNKGWLVTLGRDLQINLLHPLLRHQFSLPPMLKFPMQYEYHENYAPEEDADQFILKVAISSKLLTCNTDVSLCHHRATPPPIVMAVYGDLGFLGFARLGDKVRHRRR